MRHFVSYLVYLLLGLPLGFFHKGLALRQVSARELFSMAFIEKVKRENMHRRHPKLGKEM